MVRQQDPQERVTPDQLKINSIQAERLSALSGESIKELQGLSHTAIADKLRWRLDAALFLFRRVCGRVVKRDPVTGVEYPVPNATVTVEDTDCNFVAYAPSGSKSTWFFPFWCRREVLATVRTDACGRFCVWIPRWDIDWILHWRKIRYCFPVIFERPNVWDILEKLPIVPPRPWPGPGPGLDPLEILSHVGRLGRSQLTAALGEDMGVRVAELARSAAFGGSAEAALEVLSAPAFQAAVPPPLPTEFRSTDRPGVGVERRSVTPDLVRSTLAERLGLDLARFKDFDLHRCIGPFPRCFTWYVPEWSVVVDVPDITFRVTQDVDGDGTEEVIYSEGYFDVRWNAGTIPPLTLVASDIARESRVCDAPPVACGTVPDIQFAGMMRLQAPYHDNVSGYALRPNRPKVPIGPRPAATAPFCWNVNLFGCLVGTGGATKYRLIDKFSTDGGTTFTPEFPLTGEWWWHPIGSPPVKATPDANGWYDFPSAGVAGPEQNFLYPFATASHANALHEIRLEVGTGGATVTAASAPVRLRTDNSGPQYTPSILWRVKGGADPTWHPLGYPCPVVPRGAGQTIEFDVRWEVWASHYRDAGIGTGDCGAGSFALVGVEADSTASDPGGTSDWHSGPIDNAVTFHVRYELPPSALQGTYSFNLLASSRAFSPAGADPNYQALDWFYDRSAGEIYVNPAFYFSVVNA